MLSSNHTPIPEEKVEESQGGLTDMANVLLLCDKLPLYGNGLRRTQMQKPGATEKDYLEKSKA